MVADWYFAVLHSIHIVHCSNLTLVSRSVHGHICFLSVFSTQACILKWLNTELDCDVNMYSEFLKDLLQMLCVWGGGGGCVQTFIYVRNLFNFLTISIKLKDLINH